MLGRLSPQAHSSDVDRAKTAVILMLWIKAGEPVRGGVGGDRRRSASSARHSSMNLSR